MEETSTGLLLEAGYSKPIIRIKLNEKDTLQKILKTHFGVLRCKAELDQLKNGLSILGVGKALCDHPDLMDCFFLSSKAKPLNAGIHVIEFIGINCCCAYVC